MYRMEERTKKYVLFTLLFTRQYTFSMFVSKGSEQDLALTRKLLKTKGDMSGKGEYCCLAQFERLVSSLRNF